jgi:hypothetical protein
MGGWSLGRKGLIKAYPEADEDEDDDDDDDISNLNSSVVTSIHVNHTYLRHEILTVITSFKKALSNLKYCLS